MKYSQVKKIKQFCENLHSDPDYRDVISHAGDDDFEVDGVRFIADSDIDRIQCEELESDKYILGCFNSDFLSGVLKIDQDVIEAMQKAEAFEAIGKLVISLGNLEEFQQAYSSADGYGHHFNNYDGNDKELMLDGQLYHVFDNRG